MNKPNLQINCSGTTLIFYEGPVRCNRSRAPPQINLYLYHFTPQLSKTQ